MTMWKFLLLTFLALAKADVWDENSSGEPRLCPDGFVYIGDDETRARDIVFEVLDETEPYSCYKIMDEPMNYLDARDACGELNIKAKVLTLDGLHEAERFTREFNETLLGSSQSYLTSALYYEKGWHWMGANATANFTELVQWEGDEDLACLNFVIDEDFSTLFVPVSCSEESNFACEIRVRTVTLQPWLVANWFSVLLVFLVVVLLISLCISTSMHRTRGPRRVYRSSGSVFEHDNPPSYSHATGQTKAQRYMEKGREYLAKVTITRQEENKA